MAQVLIRGLDEKTVEKLKEVAKSNGRSLQAELRELLSQRALVADRLAAAEEARRIREKLKKWKGRRPGPDSTDLVRELRDRWNR